MKIPQYTELNDTAVLRLSQARDARKIALIYALSASIAAALVTGTQFALDARISQSGGLGGLGIRSLLSSVAQFLPIVQTIFMVVLEFGYLACMVRISRGQYTSVRTLKTGVDRFGPLIRLNILRTLIYFAVGFGAFYLSILLFVFSPFSGSLTEIMTPFLNNGSLLSGSAVLDAATQQAIAAAIRPAFVILGLVLLAVFPPIFYRYRMSDYILYDHPEVGAAFALRESRKLMRSNRMDLFKLDLRFWWYYGLIVLASLIAYGDLVLYLLGITLPLSENVIYFLFYFLSLAIQFAVLYFLRNRIETIYALAYEALRPVQKDTGVVLGNIFQA